MCGRRKIEKEYPELVNWGDMPIEMVLQIAKQIPRGVFVQLHWNGEPLLYPDLGSAIRYFSHCYTGLDTNGKLLVEKKDELSLLDTLTISVIQDDPEGAEQLEIIDEYLLQTKLPSIVIFRVLGNIGINREMILNDFTLEFKGVNIARRVLHSPNGSHDYEKPVTIPETGVCQEMLHKLSIDRFGNVSPCVRFDPHGKNRLGIVSNISSKDPFLTTLNDIWCSGERQSWVQAHLEGRRSDVPLCAECHYWGIPRG
ncbi:MAG: radical SAM/SPASM domain-containing protein [Desulfobacteraceae bacterium]|nr:MAG: radical SAM/SPASM domain-containing protein [Desulfobacteraceae bacterium]